MNSLFCLNVMACMPHVLHAFNHIFIIFHFIFLLFHLFHHISSSFNSKQPRKKHRSIYLFPIFTDHANCKSNATLAIKTLWNCAYTNKLGNCCRSQFANRIVLFLVFVCESVGVNCVECTSVPNGQYVLMIVIWVIENSCTFRKPPNKPQISQFQTLFASVENHAMKTMRKLD